MAYELEQTSRVASIVDFANTNLQYMIPEMLTEAAIRQGDAHIMVNFVAVLFENYW